MAASLRSALVDLGDSFKRINVSFRTPEKDLAEADWLYNLGRTKAAEGKHGIAVQAYHKALTIQRQHLGENSPEAGRTLNDIGVSLMESGAGEEDYAALTAFEEALYIRQTACGDGSEEAVETMSNMWKLLHRVRKREERDAAAGRPNNGEKDGERPPLGEPVRRKSSISPSPRSRPSHRLSSTIAEAIDEGRRRSTVALNISERDQKMLELLISADGEDEVDGKSKDSNSCGN